MTTNASTHDPARKRSICIFSLSCIPDDPRVRRQGDTFHAAGWEVHAFGINEPRSELPAWSVHPGNWSPPLDPTVCGGDKNSAGDHQVRPVESVVLAEQDDADKAQVVDASEAMPASSTSEADSTVTESPFRSAARERLPTSVYAVLRPIAVALVSLYWGLIALYWKARRAVAFLYWKLRWIASFMYWRSRQAISFVKWALLSLPRRLLDVVRWALFHLRRSIPHASGWLSRYTDRDYYHEIAVFRHEYRKARKAKRDPQSALDGYFEHSVIQGLYDAAKSIKADIYLANDWHTIPVALRLAKENGGYLCYDTHEYALEEYLHHWNWRMARLPIARAVEGIGLKEAIVASTVSAGIGEDMARVYGLEKPLMEIRNVQNYTEVAYQPVQGDKIRVLYHGLIVKARGLEECVRSVKLWREEFEFLMRGPVSDEFKAELLQIAQENGVADRVKFLPPVPMLDLIHSAASEADIGMSTPPKLSRHHIYALPNKFFEYIQAGLALCIADLPDMGRIVREHDLGLLIPEVEAQHIANTINAFTRESVNRYKLNSLKAAKVLNWEVESQKLLTIYEAALTQRGR